MKYIATRELFNDHAQVMARQDDGSYSFYARLSSVNDALRVARLLNLEEVGSPKYSIYSGPVMSNGDKFTITTTTTIGEK